MEHKTDQPMNMMSTSPWGWREKLRFKLMPSWPCRLPEAPATFKDCIIAKIVVGFSWTDRLRVLLTGHVHVELRTATENVCGDCETAGVAYPIWRPKRGVLTSALLLLLAVSLASCASVKFPPRLPDGSVDGPKLLEWASDGIEADCLFSISANVCTFGRQTVTEARAAIAADPTHPNAALSLSLARSVAKWPVIAPYVQFVRDVLQ